MCLVGNIVPHGIWCNAIVNPGSTSCWPDKLNLKRIRINDDRLCYVREYIILAKNMSQLAEFAECA